MRRWEMGDPLQVAMRREEASCKGCKYKEEMFGREFCAHPQHGVKELRRCRFYTLKRVAKDEH